MTFDARDAVLALFALANFCLNLRLDAAFSKMRADMANDKLEEREHTRKLIDERYHELNAHQMPTAKKKRAAVVDKKGAFLAAYVATARVFKAAAAVKMDRSLHYYWMQTDEDYRARFKRATEEAAQLLEDEAVRRAHDGVEEPLSYRGEISYHLKLDKEGLPIPNGHGGYQRSKRPVTIRKYSDTLLLALLKAFRPEKYRERYSAELTGANGEAIAISDERLKKLTDEQLTQLRAIALSITAPGSDRVGDSPAQPKQDSEVLPA